MTTFPPPILKLSPPARPAIHEPLGGCSRIVATDFCAEIATKPANVADDRMAGANSAEPLEASLSEGLRTIDQLLLLDDPHRREPCCASDGTLFVGVMSERRIRRAIEAGRVRELRRAA